MLDSEGGECKFCFSFFLPSPAAIVPVAVCTIFGSRLQLSPILADRARTRSRSPSKRKAESKFSVEKAGCSPVCRRLGRNRFGFDER